TRAAVEERMGIPPPFPGEGTRWHLEFTPYLMDGSSDRWLAGTFAVVMAVFAIAIYMREGPTVGGPYKLLLAGLRWFFVLLTLAVLLPQLQLSFEREGWPDVAILIDDSQSMSKDDQYEDPRVQEAVARLAQETSLSVPERLQLAQ